MRHGHWAQTGSRMERREGEGRMRTRDDQIAGACEGAGGQGFRHVAFTFVEIVFVVAITGLLLALAIPSLTQYVYKTRVIKTIVDIHSIENDVTWHLMRTGELPESLADIDRDALADPWRRAYVYVKITNAAAPVAPRTDAFDVPLNSDYDLYSRGPDGISETCLTNPCSGNDIIRARDGDYVGLASDF
jgi:general secretion pathway protein G